MSDLLNMYAQGPKACISGKSQVYMLQLLCSTSIVIVTVG